MLQLAKEAGRTLHSRGSRNAFGFIRTERFPWIRMARQRRAKADRVFECLTCTLRDVLQHWMRGVAEQCDAPARPRGNGKPIEHRPPPIAPHQVNSLANGGAQA